MRIIITLILALGIAFSMSAKDGYHIEMKIDNFKGDSIILASYYGQNNVIVDTFGINTNGTFIAKGKESLSGGIYLVILPPKNEYFELIVDKEQHFSLETDTKNFVSNMKLKNSQENKMFYDYFRFLAEKRKEVKDMEQRKEKATEIEKQEIEKERNKLDDEVEKYFNHIKTQYPHTILSLLLKATQAVKMPKHLQEKTADKTAKYYYYKKHYFDHLDRGDERLLRSNFFFKRMNHYVEKLTPQVPDSIQQSIDYILEPMKKDGDMFKYYLSYFLNKYAKSKIVGMDAVYVHLVNQYYKKGLAPWTNEDILKKIIKDANALEPILIGKKAPNLKMRKKDGSEIELDTIQSDYVVLYFWDPECGHCKKASPQMIAFQNKYKSKSVQLLGICTKLRDEVKDCWKTIDERGYNWLNLVDPFMRSRYKVLYNIKSTPQIFILDKNKTIKMKRIGSDQLDEVMDKIMAHDQEQWNKE